MQAVALISEHGPPINAVAGVDLDPAFLDQLPAGPDDIETLDLLSIATRSGKHQHGNAVVAPPGHVDRAVEERRVPTLNNFAHWSARQVWIRSQNFSVYSSIS